jgi:hypothetical protein
MMPHRRIGSVRKAVLAVTALIPFAGCGTAYATDCNQDIGTLSKKRQDILDQLNKLAQGGKKQLDPIASCPKLRALVAVEHQLLAYVTKNKDWCAVPDEAFQNISQSTGKSSKVANQACTIAAKMKKAQQQQASGALNVPQPKLPAGPL